MGRFEESVAMIEMAIRLNPMPPSTWYVFLATALANAGRYDEAASVSRRAVKLAPNNLFAQLILVLSCIRGGCDEEARYAAAEVLRIQPGFSVDDLAKRLPYKNPLVIEQFVNDLRNAGLR
jgi:adenylate cyclase